MGSKLVEPKKVAPYLILTCKWEDTKNGSCEIG